MACGDGGLQLIRSGPLDRARALEAVEAARDPSRIPARAILIGQQDELPAASVRAAAREACSSISASSPSTSDSSGISSASMRPRRIASSHEIVADERLAGVSGVALVEDQIDHGQHRGQALGQLVRVGYLVR